jgi:hypothetical protein
LIRLKKHDGLISGSRCFGFGSFRVKIERRENMRKYEDQAHLRHGKREWSINKEI